MLKKFMKSKSGEVSSRIIIIAILLGIGLYFFGYLKLSSASQTDDSVDGIDYVLENGTKKPINTTASLDAINNPESRLEYAMVKPKIEVSPDSAEYFYSVNDVVDFKAIAQKGNGYNPKGAYACKWEGINYTGESGEPKSIRLNVGENNIKVILCDARKACAENERKIYLGYRDPMLVIHEEWDNYVLSGDSGEWKYDKATNTIHTTQNVNWTGYWNSEDVELKDYTLTFKMAVTRAGDDDTIGFTFRQTDSKNLYFLAVDNRATNGGATHSGVYKKVNGTQTRLVDLMPLKWEVGEWMDVKIKVQGTIIMVWINGTLVANIDDSSHPKGGYGPFSISQAYASYKDLKITFE